MFFTQADAALPRLGPWAADGAAARVSSRRLLPLHLKRDLAACLRFPAPLAPWCGSPWRRVGLGCRSQTAQFVELQNTKRTTSREAALAAAAPLSGARTGPPSPVKPCKPFPGERGVTWRRLELRCSWGALHPDDAAVTRYSGRTVSTY